MVEMESTTSLFLPVGPLPTGRQAVPTEGGAGREGGIKALPFLMGLLFYFGDLCALQADASHQALLIEEKRIDLGL